MKLTIIAIPLICFAFLTSGCDNPTEENTVVIAKNGLPSVKGLIAKPKLKGLLKKKLLSENESAKLLSALTGYNEKLIEISINLITDNDVDFSKFGSTDKLLTIKFSDQSYSEVVTATAASMLINGHPISEAGDTQIGCVLKSKIPPLSNLYSLSGGTITIWIEKKNWEIVVYGVSQLNQSYDVLGINDKRLRNIFDGTKQYLGLHQSFEEAGNLISK